MGLHIKAETNVYYAGDLKRSERKLIHWTCLALHVGLSPSPLLAEKLQGTGVPISCETIVQLQSHQSRSQRPHYLKELDSTLNNQIAGCHLFTGSVSDSGVLATVGHLAAAAVPAQPLLKSVIVNFDL